MHPELGREPSVPADLTGLAGCLAPAWVEVAEQGLCFPWVRAEPVGPPPDLSPGEFGRQDPGQLLPL